jgi:probable lipoprotein NlpC
MKYLFFSILLFLTSGLFAFAPLDGGFAHAPRGSVSQEERVEIYSDVRNKVINAAMKYENVPYRYGGMTPTGLDCSGLVCLSFKDAIDVNLPRSAAGLYSWAETIPIDIAQPGDLLFFKTDNTGRITHVAIYLGNGYFIHSASSGPQTGVIYSNLNERYWARSFAGAGRAFPETPGYQFVLAGGNSPVVWNNTQPGRSGTASFSGSSTRFLYGAAFAPTWKGFYDEGSVVRGFTSQFRLGADTGFLKTRMLFGFELRPEYDGALGVFRLPFTLSWGLDDKYRIFAGPVISFGSASLYSGEGERFYSGGTSWLGTIGVTAAPFIIKTKNGEFAPYIETAWQSYFYDGQNRDLSADFTAHFRFSTGLRWTTQF